MVTGPPGTGKSQVVAAILVNAAWRGLRVLFASKNNKAVDVVLERVNALSPRPIMLRLGTRALQEELAQQITAILSARLTDEDRRAYESMRVKLRLVDEELQRLALQAQHLIELRNRVDTLERAAEGTRHILPAASFENADKLSIAEAEARIADLREALRRSKREEAPFFQRLFWAFLKVSRNRQLLKSVCTLDKALARLGFAQKQTFLPERSLAEGVEFIEALKAASAYKTALKLLSSAPDMGELAAKVADQTQTLADVSSEAWIGWTALLPDRLNDQDRAVLGDYAAILRTISKANEEGGTIANQIWRRYYQLAAAWPGSRRGPKVPTRRLVFSRLDLLR